jgi:hypothetical protein
MEMDEALLKRIEREVAAWPPLTEEQRDAIGMLLNSPSPVEQMAA